MQFNKNNKVKQFVTDKKGHKIAAILDIEELTRLEELLEDLIDLKCVEDRVNEQGMNYESYSRPQGHVTYDK
ncbi:MAG: hypothetical protein ABFR82_12910 [Nitrospirota bacterium]